MSVYTPVTLAEASDFLAAYPIGPPLSLTGVAEGVVNTNYRLTTAQGRYILTLMEDPRQGEELPHIVALLNHLAGRAIPCPAPVHDRRGAAIGLLHGKAALLVTHLPGSHLLNPDPQQCRQVGAMLARMHLAAADYPAPLRPNPMGLERWRILLLDLAPLLDRPTAELLHEELAHTEAAFLPLPLAQGCCHLDLFPDNVLFDGAALTGVIDFHYAGAERLVYDLAVTLDAWCYRPDGACQEAHWHALLAGYQRHRPLPEAERAALGDALRAASLRFALTRLHAQRLPRSGPEVTRKAPQEFLDRLHWQRTHPLPRQVSPHG